MSLSLRAPRRAASALTLAGAVATTMLSVQGCSSSPAPDESIAGQSSAQVRNAKLWILNRNGNPSMADYFGCLLGHTGWNQLATQYAYPESLSFGKEAWVSGSACNPGGPDDHGAFQCAVDAGGFDVSPYDIVLIIRDDSAAGGQNDSGGGTSVKNPVTHATVPVNTAEIGNGRAFNTWDYLFVYASHEVFEAQTDGVSGDCCDGETAWGGKFNWCPQCGGPSGGCGQHQGDLGIAHITCPSGHTYPYQKMSPPGAHEFDGTCVGFSVVAQPSPTPTPKPTSGCGTIQPGQGLVAGQSYSSCDGVHTLSMQTDGNLVLYHNGKGATWASNTYKSDGYAAVMQGDGNFVLYGHHSNPLWASGTNGHGGSTLAVQNDGNLVVYAPGNKAIWASHTNGK